jgi:hypothetical protein
MQNTINIFFCKEKNKLSDVMKEMGKEMFLKIDFV